MGRPSGKRMNGSNAIMGADRFAAPTSKRAPTAPSEAPGASIAGAVVPMGARGRVKRALDLAAALGLLVFAAPLLLGVALAMKLQDGGPVLFRHYRCGRHGRTFALWKFRTMHADAAERLTALLDDDPHAEAEWIATRKLRADPRVTRLGRFLRRSSLDELPQLVNVLRGDMSVVGPRPVMPEELARYGALAPVMSAARPGLTGLWQVSGRNDLDFSTRIALDTDYVRQWSLVRDAAILARTVPVVLLAKGAY